MKDYTDFNYLYLQEQINSQRAFDKSLLTISAGSFGVSFAFIENLISINPDHEWLIIFSWCLFSISIFSQLSSHFLSFYAFSAEREINQSIIDGLENVFTKWTIRLNYFSLISFVVGMVFMIYFISINVDI